MNARGFVYTLANLYHNFIISQYLYITLHEKGCFCTGVVPGGEGGGERRGWGRQKKGQPESGVCEGLLRGRGKALVSSPETPRRRSESGKSEPPTPIGPGGRHREPGRDGRPGLLAGTETGRRAGRPGLLPWGDRRRSARVISWKPLRDRPPGRFGVSDSGRRIPLIREVRAFMAVSFSFIRKLASISFNAGNLRHPDLVMDSFRISH